MSDLWRRLRARIDAMEPERVNALVAVAVFALLELELALHPLGDDRLLAHALGLVVLAGLLVRRRAPELCVVAMAGVLTAFEQIPSLNEGVLVSTFVFFYATYSLGALLEGRRLVLATALSAVVILIAIGVDPQGGLSADNIFFGLGVFLGAPVLVGSIMRSRSAIARALREKARYTDAERARLAAEAVEEERTRIAGELHDVVAHALSAMVVQASAARRLVTTNPTAAAGAFDAIEHSGRDALTEIRSLLGVLRREDEDLALAPQPSLAHVSSLVNRARTAGLGVSFTVEGEPRPLPAGIDLTAYRVLQEALGEAIDPGAAGSATVRIVYGPSDVALEVRDDGHAPADRPLLGVRERVALYGGELRALRPGGARGGHVVRARLPAGSAA
ncbi:MAG TPA: histidine kinase [Solirubrobacteraceae bacterium]